MGATSVTGVGIGGCEGTNPMSKHQSMSTNRLIGPRIMVADVATLSSGTATVKLPLFSGAVTDYAVIISDASGTAAATSATMTFGSNVTTVTLKGTSANVVYWAVLKQGMVL
jgi:hypothetical protein